MCNLSSVIEEKAIRRGMQKGMQKGMQQGMQNERFNILQNMINAGLTVEQIKACGYTEEEIQQIVTK